MKNNLFDSYVKQSLENFRPEVPPHIWENIVAGKDRKKPFGFWRGLSALNIAAALLVSVLASGTVYLLMKDNAPTNRAPLVKENNIQNNNSSNNTNSNTADINADQNIPSDNNASANNSSSPISSGNVATNRQQINNPGKIAFAVNTSAENEENILKAEKNKGNNEHYLHAGNYDAKVLKMRSAFNFRLSAMPTLSKALNIPCPRAEQDAAGNKQYVEIYGGPDYIFRDISDASGSAYLEQRKATTKMLFSYSAGARYTRVFGSGMSLRAGINYSRINEAFKLLKGHVTQNVYITDASGDTTGTYTVTGTQYKQATNKYTNIDIPVTAGYEFGNGRLHTNINAGVMVNIMSKKSGFVVDNNGNAVDLNDKQSSVYRYKTNAGVSLTGGVSFYYKLNDNLHVLAEPYFRYSLSPATRSELSFKEKYHTAGLRVGIRADL